MNTHLRPLKRFGQHFLFDRNIIKKIIEAMKLSRRDCVLEIGPGRGALTFELARRAKRLIAVEIDRGLHRQLRDKFKDAGNVDIVSCDILKFELKKYIKKHRLKTLKVFGNLPFYLTTPIIEYLFNNSEYINDIFITVQKEVAQRMTASPATPEYGSLTCFLNYYCRPRVLFKIKRGSFWPAPKVESCFMSLSLFKAGERQYRVKSEELLFKVIRSAFSQRRKKLRSSLSGILGEEQLGQLAPSGMLSHRAEELSITDFVRLGNLIFDFSAK